MMLEADRLIQEVIAAESWAVISFSQDCRDSCDNVPFHIILAIQIIVFSVLIISVFTSDL